MSEPRLVIFCSDTDSDLRSAVSALEEIFELAHLAAPKLVNLTPPDAMRSAGFRALTISSERLTDADSARRLSQHLHAITRTFARTLREEVLGVFADVATLEAQACFHPPGGFPRSVDGDAFQVLRQAAGWLETDANAFLGFFGGYDVIQKPANAIPKLPELTEPIEPDEEDQFVELRLKQARDLMARYKSHA